MLDAVLGGIHGFFVGREPERVLVDILDILLVAYVMYHVMLLLRGTRAMQINIGLALVFLVYHFARRTGLITLFTLLDAVLRYAVLIVVVIFQNDIRRALMRVGRQSIFRRASGARESQAVEEVVKAAQALANKRIGALLVFEREAALDEFIEHGTRLDAVVTKELLYSIFVPSYENPMHDGAVVIRNGRVWEAGAFLPLTESTKVDRMLGTRHRAAIGISEETDAVVVVVSEERGTASVCFGGNIVRDLEGNTLRQALVGLFERPKNRRDNTGRRRPKRTRDSEPAPATSEEREEGSPAAPLSPEAEETPR